jgi:PIN domain nuclease of toxin-antitoxin system
MKFLLDTHVILWLAYEDKKLSKMVREILLNQESEIYISAVSFWEIGLKFQTGKLDLRGHNPEALKNGFDIFFNFNELDITLADGVTFYKLDSPIHKDPFDRMLVWQALKHGLTLLSDDENIKKYQEIGLKVLW